MSRYSRSLFRLRWDTGFWNVVAVVVGVHAFGVAALLPSMFVYTTIVDIAVVWFSFCAPCC